MTAGRQLATGQPPREEGAVRAPLATQLTHMPAAAGAVTPRPPGAVAPVQMKNSLTYFSMETPALYEFSWGCPVLGQQFLSVVPSDPNSQPLAWILCVHLGWCLFIGQFLQRNISFSSQSG